MSTCLFIYPSIYLSIYLKARQSKALLSLSLLLFDVKSTDLQQLWPQGIEQIWSLAPFKIWWWSRCCTCTNTVSAANPLRDAMLMLMLMSLFLCLCLCLCFRSCSFPFLTNPFIAPWSTGGIVRSWFRDAMTWRGREHRADWAMIW